MTKSKVFVIALDGAPPDMIRHWIAQGKLPLFKQLIEKGSTGDLVSAVPWHTPTAWCSFMTGKNPGKHGVYDMVSRDPHNLLAMRFLSGASCKAQTLWRFLSDRGRNVGIVNVPMTYPSEEVQGFLIAGFPALHDDASFSHPKTLLTDLKNKGWDLTKGAATEVLGSLKTRFEESWKQVQTRTEASLYLMKQYPWDLFVVHFIETDRIGHVFWHFMDDKEQASNEYSDYVLKFYQRVEGAMIRLINELDEDTTLIIMSDHGMGPRRFVLSLNRWLLDQGYLVLKNNLSTRIKKTLNSPNLTRFNPVKLVPNQVLSLLIYTLLHLGSRIMRPEAKRNGAGRQEAWRPPNSLLNLFQAPMLNFSDVDWTRTAAYAFGSSYVGAIYLNLVGRRPEGIIMPGVEADRIKESISAELRKLVDLNSEKKLIKEVLKAEDLYTGPHTADAPDLIVFLNDAEYETFPATMMLRCKELIQATPNAIASHRRKGLLIIRGKGINAGISISEPSIIDLAPTILHILGEPIPTDMDGKVLRSCFVEGGHLSTKAQFDDVEVGGRNHSAVYSDEEEVLVLNRLRELGYID